MVIKMIKTSIHLPIISIYVDYSIRSKENSGLFEYTILDIFQNFSESEFNKYSFKQFFHKILQAKVPDLFIEKALEYLDNNKILISEDEDGLIDLPISAFKVSDKKILKTMLQDKVLYSKPQKKRKDLYYDPLKNQIIDINTSELTNDIENPLINGERYKDVYIQDTIIKASIETKKKKESSFNKDGVKIEDLIYLDIKEQAKREVLYRRIDLLFEIVHKKDNEYELVLDKKYEFINKYRDKLIEKLMNENSLILEDNSLNIIDDVLINNIKLVKYSKNIQVIINSKEYEIANKKDINIKIEAFITNIIDTAFKNIRDSSFYDDIRLLQELNKLLEKDEFISENIINRLINLDIYPFVNRLNAIYGNINENIKKLIDKNIFYSYIQKQNYEKSKLKDIFEKWNFYQDTKEQIQNIQNQLLLAKEDEIVSVKKDEQVIKYVLDTNILINIGLKAFDKKNLILSLAIIEELDEVKKKKPETSKTIREVQKFLSESKRTDIIYENSSKQIEKLPKELKANKIDNMILSLCFNSEEKRIFVTDDKNLQLKAKGLNIKTINSTTYLKEENR